APARREQAWDGSTVRFRSTEFIPFLPCRSICSLKRNQRNGKNGMNSVLRRSNLGGARQLVGNHEQTGAVAPSENGRLPPVLAHQLASARGDSASSTRPVAGCTWFDACTTLRC